MFDKIAAALSVVALGAASFAVYKTNTPQAAGTAEVPQAAIEAYLKENPQVIIASLEQYERDTREAAAREQAEQDVAIIADNKDEIFNDGYSFVSGNPDGDLTLVEFSDYNCGFCKRAHGEVQNFVEADGNVRVIVKEFPILGPGSVTAGRAALAAMEQIEGEAYQAFSDALMEHRGSHTEDTVMAIAEESGLDVAKLQADMESDAIIGMVEKTYELARKLQINGTPAFILGDQVVRGFVPAAQLEELARAARSS